jgi:hypothetical protein
MKMVNTHFEQVPVAMVKKKIAEEEIIKDGFHIHQGVRGASVDKVEPYSVEILRKSSR